MAKEHEFQAAESHRLCVNNCGFFGSAATENMCSKCYHDVYFQNSSDPSLFSTPMTAKSPSGPCPLVSSEKPIVSSPMRSEFTAEVAASPSQQATNRCSACRKKVGLTGFKCKCGTTFCGTHGYPEKHECTFDFKTVGKEAIAKANPLVIAEKLEKI